MVYARKGIVVRLLYLFVSSVFWVLTLGGILLRNKFIVLCYHNVFATEKDRFSKQMKMIHGRTRAADRRFHTHSRPLKSEVVVTFDDGFESLTDNAIPILSRLDIPALIFIPTANIGEQPEWLLGSKHRDSETRILSADQIKRLSDKQIVVFGSHSHIHARLTEQNPEAVKSELQRSKNILESIVGKQITTLAYPHGSFNDQIDNIAEKIGYSHRFCIHPNLESGSKTNGLFGRFLASPDMWDIEFRLTVDGSYFWLSAFRGVVKTLRRPRGSL